MVHPTRKNLIAGFIALFATFVVAAFGVGTRLESRPVPVPWQATLQPEPPPPEPEPFTMEVPDPNAAFDSFEYVGDDEAALWHQDAEPALAFETLEILQERRLLRMRRKPKPPTSYPRDCLCIIPGDVGDSPKPTKEKSFVRSVLDRF